jgi:hypothetical protein
MGPLGLCFAPPGMQPARREKINVERFRTNHHAENASMIAIDRKPGRGRIPGTCRMEERWN